MGNQVDPESIYIFIIEDGDTYQSTELSNDDLDACDAGIVQIIRVSDMTQYSPNLKSWLPLTKWYLT